MTLPSGRTHPSSLTRTRTAWLCSEIPSDANPPGNNWQFFCDKDLDALFQEQARTVDANPRTEMFKQIQKIIADQGVLGEHLG